MISRTVQLIFGMRLAALVSISLLSISTCCLAERPNIRPLLADGKLEEAEAVLADRVTEAVDDDLARFQLGTVQFLRAVERLTQQGVHYGAQTQAMALPFLRLGGYSGNKQEAPPVEYEDLREMIAQFQQSVAAAEATLATIKDESLSWDLDFKKVALDFDGDGKIAKSERLETLFRGALNRRQRNDPNQPMLVGFDSADVYWLRGYCHVLMAMADMVLAYDHQEMFDHTAHAFFANPQTDFAHDRKQRPEKRPRAFDWENVADLVAAIHLTQFTLREPQRMQSAQEHLIEVVELSRQNWRLIMLETDDHHEWIPNANQSSVITQLNVGPEQIDAWQQFLTEAEDVLTGKKLVPFWRAGFDEHLNLDRVFKEPRDFDLILWVQGSAALPYLEKGEVTAPATWRQFQRVFRGDFLGFAAWVN